MKKLSPKASFWLVALAALVFRLPYLSRQLYTDELATASWALSENIHELLELLHLPTEGNALGYPLFVLLWGKLGASELWLRLPSVTAGTFVVALFNRRYGSALASLQLGIATLFLFYSQSARVYVPWVLLLFLCLKMQNNLLKKFSWNRFGAYVFCCASALYLHHFSFLYLAPLWLQLGWETLRNRKLRKALLAVPSVCLLYLPHFSLLKFQIENGPRWFRHFDEENFANSLLSLIWMHHWLPTLCLAGVALLGAVVAWRKLALEIALALFPITACALLSFFYREMFVDRYLLPSILGFFACAAAGYEWLNHRVGYKLILVLSAPLLLSVFSLKTFYAQPTDSDWKGAADFLIAHQSDCDHSTTVVVNPVLLGRWKYYLKSPLELQGWQLGFPHKPLWLLGAGHIDENAYPFSTTKQAASLKWSGADSLAYCVKAVD